MIMKSPKQGVPSQPVGNVYIPRILHHIKCHPEPRRVASLFDVRLEIRDDALCAILGELVPRFEVTSLRFNEPYVPPRVSVGRA